MLQDNHQQMNSITNTHFSYCFFEDLKTQQSSFIIFILNMKHSHSVLLLQTILPLYGHPPFFYLFLEPCTFGNIFWQVSPNKIPDKHKNTLMWQIYLFMFRRKLENNVTCFFIRKPFISNTRLQDFPQWGEDWEGSRHHPKNWLAFTILPQKC